MEFSNVAKAEKSQKNKSGPILRFPFIVHSEFS